MNATPKPSKRHREFTGVGVYTDGSGQEAGYLISQEGEFTRFDPMVDPAPARRPRRKRGK